MSHELDYRDLFSYTALIKDLYNNHNQFYIFLFFVVPKILVLLEKFCYASFFILLGFLCQILDLI